MYYFWLKLIHILSSTILFGTGIGTAAVMLYAHMTKKPEIIAAIASYVVVADWLFTGTTGIVQPLTGFWMVHLAGYSLSSPWLIFSIIGYLVAACCWFPVVYLQIRMRDLAKQAVASNQPLTESYHACFRKWFILGWPAFISLVIVFYMMTFKP